MLMSKDKHRISLEYYYVCINKIQKDEFEAKHDVHDVSISNFRDFLTPKENCELERQQCVRYFEIETSALC
jgi:hypothetical protein